MNAQMARKGIRAAVLVAAVISSAHAAGVPPGAMPVQATVAAPDSDATHRNDKLPQIDCPSGLERYLPGSYYYCVAVHDQLGGKSARSIDMLKTAARWGSKPAQFLLGIGYFNGDTVAMDRAQGLAWLTLAAERRDAYYLAVLALAQKQASVAERERASALSQALLPEYGDAHAARRAEQRYRRARRELVRDEVFGARVCLSGSITMNVAAASGSEPPLATSRSADQMGQPGGPPACDTGQPVEQVAKQIDAYADLLFEGWSGRVTVGELQKLPVPGK